MVTTTGIGGALRPIAFGEPVFDASKLSKGDNVVALDPVVEAAWPTGSGGKTRFQDIDVKGKFAFERMLR